MASPTETKAPALAEIERRSLKQIVVERIKEALALGELEPGQTITELGLARRFGVAQNTVREALIELESQGFVERTSARKTRITKLTRRDTREIYAIRVPLEQMVLDEIAANGNQNWEDADRACERMRAAAEEDAILEFENADLDLHRALWRLAGNRHLEDILEKLVGKLFAIEHMHIRRRHMSVHYRHTLVEQHAEVLRCLKTGHIKEAKSTLAASMDRSWEDDLQLPEDLDMQFSSSPE